MGNLFRNYLKSVKETYLNDTFGRQIIIEWTNKIFLKYPFNPIRILDIGCSGGTDLHNIQLNNKSNKSLELKGLDFFNYYKDDQNRIKKLLENFHIDYKNVDVEHNPIPFPDHSIDLIISNQTIEHVREIYWIFSEISRILKPDGYMIIGVPNMASWYGIYKLITGWNPPAIETLGVHVRGYTKNSLKKFIEAENFFQVVDFKGSDFYPFPPKIGRILCKLFPKHSISIYFLVKRTKKKGNFISVLQNRNIISFFEG